MGNPRIPAGKAKVSGADVSHPGRHKARKEPKVSSLGEPSAFLDKNGVKAWAYFKQEMPWLGESDRALVEIASSVRGRLLSGEDVGITALSMLQSILTLVLQQVCAKSLLIFTELSIFILVFGTIRQILSHPVAVVKFV